MTSTHAKERMRWVLELFCTKDPITLRKLALIADVTTAEMSREIFMNHPDIQKAGYLTVQKGLSLKARLVRRVET